ncbi:MAG: pilin [Gammaproteobacteria bacterium]|nr:pilin [Gammaproteobacteria bacterium]
MDENTYRVVITNQLPDDQDKHLIIKNLAALFKTSEQQAAQLLQKPETIVKKNLDKTSAEKYHAAITKTGAACKIINTVKEEPALPDIMEPVAPTVIAEHSSFIQTALENTKKTELEARQHQQLKELDNFSEKTFCTECGTIKNSATAVCLHCGYDPQAPEIKNRKIRKYASILLGITALIIIAYLVALPFYNTYASRSKIENGLGLAFDTRNTITAFILKTSFWPNQNIDANLPQNISNEIIESIVIGEHAMFVVTVRAQALNKEQPQTLIFIPKLLKDKLVWNCTQGTLDNEFRPDICKTNQR